MKTKIVRKIPEKKTALVKELTELIKNKKTILVASIKNLPASQFQEISKKLRDKAVIKVPKKNLIFRAVDESGDEKAKELKKYIKADSALLFSDIDPFELASDLFDNKSPAKARIGQESPRDIEVEAGPTDLVPGPAISELGALGIQIQIDKGKINIKEPKVIVKKGEEISENAASLMNKLDIKPFSVGFIPLLAFDTKEGKLYLEINVNKEETLEELKKSFGKSLAFAVEINHINEDTLKFILAKAAAHENVLNNLIKEEKTEKKVEEKEESKNTENTPEENKEENK